MKIDKGADVATKVIGNKSNGDSESNTDRCNNLSLYKYAIEIIYNSL